LTQPEATWPLRMSLRLRLRLVSAHRDYQGTEAGVAGPHRVTWLGSA